ncbi:MAG: 50S ribosomal protein L1, partial [Proteobacteria bacterium]|nr:50S ribosomal protein L1 [Pseudomonadota bacterium]
MVKKTKEKRIEKHSAENIQEAIQKIVDLANTKKRKFVESVDVAINLGIDAKQSDQSVKGSILLPHGSGKKVRVIVFTGNEDQKKVALDSG